MPVVHLKSQSTSPTHDAELSRLEALHKRFRETREGRVVSIVGPTGQWTEQLVSDFKRSLIAQRETVFEAACLAHSGRTYGPIRQLLAQIYSHVETLGLISAELAEQYARLTASMGQESYLFQPTESDVRDHIQLYHKLAQLLQELTRLSTSVIVLHDVHLGDSTTRAALRFVIERFTLDDTQQFALAEHTSPSQAMWILTAQGAATDELVPLGVSHGDVIDLSGVDEEAVRSFLQEPEVVRRFLASSAGNVDNLRALVDDLPEGLDDLLVRRLLGLPAEARAVLEVLATYNRPCAPELLARLLSKENVAFAQNVRLLLDEKLLAQKIDRGQFLLTLATPQSQSAIYNSLNETRRAAIHDGIARLLEERLELGQTVDIEEIAHHFLRGSNPQKAVSYALDAAERLHITFAYQREAEFLAAALPRLSEDARRFGVLERLVDLHFALNSHRRALYYCGQLKAALPVAERFPAYLRTARVLLEMARYRQAINALERASALVPENGADRRQLDALLAEASYGQGDRSRARALCDSGLDGNNEVSRLNVDFLNTRGKVLIADRQFVEARTAFEQAIALCDEHFWPEERVRARFNCGIVALHLEEHAAAETIFRQCLNEGHYITNLVIRAFCLLNLAVLYHKTLRWKEALEYYLHSLATFQKSGNDFQFVATALNIAELYLELGAHERAKALTEAAARVLEKQEIHHYSAWRLQLDGRIALEERDYPKALDCLTRAEPIAVDKAWAKRRELYIDLARVAFILGNEEDFLRYIDLERDTLRSDECEALTERLEGQVAQSLGEHDRARTKLGAAARFFAGQKQDHLLWETLHELAEIEFAVQNDQAGRILIQRAQEISRRLVDAVPESLKANFTTRAPFVWLYSSLVALSEGRPTSFHQPTLPVHRLGPSSKIDAEIRSQWQRRYPRIVGRSSKLGDVFRRVDLIAESRSPVLLLGESGTGKELLADAIHCNSNRSEKPFVKVNCGALVETLLLSELFGHEKGAFTGAMGRKVGRFEMADGGTLFLDEIGDISPKTQLALLRVLQEGTFERVGGNQTLKTNVRIICATNKRLEQLVKTGEFRLDLYYRIKGIVFELPPLRERLEDVPMMVRHFLQEVAGDQTPKGVSRAAMRRLLCYSWPGNIRELQNFVQSVALFVAGSEIGLEELAHFDAFFSDGETRQADDEIDQILEECITPRPDVAPSVSRLRLADSGPQLPEDSVIDQVLSGDLGLAEMKKKIEIACIRRALNETNGNISKAADLLQMKRPRLSQIINATPELSEVKHACTESQ